MSYRRPLLIPSVLSIIFLVVALFSIKEYGYFILLRWVVSFTSVYFAYYSYLHEKVAWTWIMGLIAVLFNPILPIPLKRETWRYIDYVTALLIVVHLLAHALHTRKRKAKNNAHENGTPEGKALKKRKTHSLTTDLYTCNTCGQKARLEIQYKKGKRYFIVCPNCKYSYELNKIY